MSARQVHQPLFLRGEIASILGCTVDTVKNREVAGTYPDPKRDVNDYRIYTIHDALVLQMITHNHIDTRPILSLLHDKGYSQRQIMTLVEQALKRLRG